MGRALARIAPPEGSSTTLRQKQVLKPHEGQTRRGSQEPTDAKRGRHPTKARDAADGPGAFGIGPAGFSQSTWPFGRTRSPPATTPPKGPKMRSGRSGGSIGGGHGRKSQGSPRATSTAVNWIP